MSKKIGEIFDKVVTQVTKDNIPERIEELEKEIQVLRKTLETYGIIEEVHVTNIELICQKGIEDLKDISRTVGLTQDDAKVLDLLHKNLRMARGNLVKKEAPGKVASEADLLKIVKNDK